MNNKKIPFFLIILSLLFLPGCNHGNPSQKPLVEEQAHSNEHLGIPINALETTEKISLQIKERIPPWLKGSYVRNGPAKFKVGEQVLAHWFDGFAMLASFEFNDNKIYYRSRYLQSDQLVKSLNSNSLQIEGFAQNFGKVPYDHVSRDGQKIKTANANINIEKINNHYVALGETPLPIEFELSNLKTKNIFDYNDNLKKANIWESAHMKRDPKSNTIYNFYIDYGRKSYYVLYKIENNKSERVILSRKEVDKPSYMHDFSITRNYIILTAYPLTVKPVKLLNPKVSFIKAHTWVANRGTRIYIFEKSTGKLLKELNTNSMFAFHHINAFETQDGLINLYLNAYEDANVINEIGKYPCKYPELSLRQLKINLKNSTVKSSIVSKESFEMPNIKGDLVGSKNEYFYSIWYSPTNITQGLGIAKYNLQTNHVTSWAKEGLFPGEPIFIGKPDGKAEDDGVVLTIVFDTIKKECFLLILDAANMKELVRANLPQMLPFGLHGKFFNLNNQVEN